MKGYSEEINVQILIALLKVHGIKKIVISPGATNVSFVASVQSDSFFELFSVVDERSAAYVACGLAIESNEVVALSCTGATASRNYFSGLTEAYYSKLPIVAITSSQQFGKIGHNIPQLIDRSIQPKDLLRCSVRIPTVHNDEEKWAYEMLINKVLLEAKRHGGGPVHIDLETEKKPGFFVTELPKVKKINRYFEYNALPKISAARIGILVGSHRHWEKRQEEVIEKFCEIYNAVVLCNPISNYRGKYKIFPAIMGVQRKYISEFRKFDLVIHIGEITDYSFNGIDMKEVWRVSPDGEIRDTYKRLTNVFEMEEVDFFEKYCEGMDGQDMTLYSFGIDEYKKLYFSIPEIPFSNLWIAMKTINELPNECLVYLGILNTLRHWGLFECDKSVSFFSNTGGFGIDGGVSTLIGMSLADRNRLCFAIVGDLSFFYDMNSLGIRHIDKNVRIMVLNNGRGTEFRNYEHPAAVFGDETDKYIAAAGHYGNRSKSLIRHMSEDLGFRYITASNKEEYIATLDDFVDATIAEPIVFEVFLDSKDETEAMRIVYNL